MTGQRSASIHFVAHRWSSFVQFHRGKYRLGRARRRSLGRARRRSLGRARRRSLSRARRRSLGRARRRGPWAALAGLVTHFLYQFISASPAAPAAAMTDQASRPSCVQAFLQVALARHPQPFHNLRLRRAWIIAQVVQNVVKSAFLMSASVAHRRSPFLKIVADPPDPNRTSLGVFNIMISIAHLPPAFNQFNLISRHIMV
jgi:hypothetical protein